MSEREDAAVGWAPQAGAARGGEAPHPGGSCDRGATLAAGGRVTDHREAVRHARQQLDLARDRFEQAIRDAHKAGVSLRAIAEDAELSHQRVHQLTRTSSANSSK